MTIGNKADNLLRLQQWYPHNVPPFELLPFEEVIYRCNKITREAIALTESYLNDTTPEADLEEAVERLSKSLKLNKKTLETYDRKIQLHEWSRVSIRTSAVAEDGGEHSFAGQYVTFVDIEYDRLNLEECVLKSFCSLFSARVLRYAKAKKLKTLDIGGSAVVQQMFYGQASGVMFTENGRGELALSFSDSWKNTTVEGNDAKSVCIPKTSLKAPGAPIQMQRLAQLGLELEQKERQSLDIEWAYKGGEIMLLQMRPVTTNTTSYRLTWDATNISENYPGVTLPLTYSFIQTLYAQVYPSFFSLMGMSSRALKQNSQVFENVLGYINGRVYYRIENWYDLIKLIPGRRNQLFFEEMLNPVKKKGAEASASRWALLNPTFLILSFRFGWLLVRSSTMSKSFSIKFAKKYEEYNRLDWSTMTVQASLSHIRSIRQELLVLWGIPILNDVKVIIFHGFLKTALFKNSDNAAYLRFLQGLTDQASVQPLRALHQLGEEIEKKINDNGAAGLAELKSTKAWPQVELAAKEFIEKFGGRTPDELQLENPRLAEDVWNVIELAYASKGTPLTPLKHRQSIDLKGQPLLRQVLGRFAIRNVRQAIDYRERFRFNRAQVFGLARRAYAAIGEGLAAEGVILRPEDVFWLTEAEIESLIEGHSWSYDLKPTVAQRKLEHITYNKKPFWLHVSADGLIPAVHPVNTTTSGASPAKTGIGVSVGRLSASVVVAHEFSPTLNVKGKILVVKHMDPGWTLLLVQAAGVITEQGNALSHVAIVSREIGIPAIVGVEEATKRFKNGDHIIMDGASGEIIHGS